MGIEMDEVEMREVILLSTAGYRCHYDSTNGICAGGSSNETPLAFSVSFSATMWFEVDTVALRQLFLRVLPCLSTSAPHFRVCPPVLHTSVSVHQCSTLPCLYTSAPHFRVCPPVLHTCIHRRRNTHNNCLVHNLLKPRGHLQHCILVQINSVHTAITYRYKLHFNTLRAGGADLRL